MIETTLLTPGQDAPAFTGMTFSHYTHLLTEAESNRIVAVPLAATVDGVAAGLVLGGLPTPGTNGEPSLFSIFVAPAYRHQGVGTRLMEVFHEEIARRGGQLIRVIYMNGKESTPFFERILQKTGWETPTPRMAALKTDLVQLRAADPSWLRPRRVDMDRFRIVAWSDVTEEQKQALRRSHEAEKWIAEDLVPWKHETKYDPVTSCALLRDGELVSWVINHLMPDGTTRFTCSFAHPRLQRFGVVFWLYKEATDRMDDHGRRFFMLTVPLYHPGMHAFAMRCVKPHALYWRETYGCEKRLAP